MGLTSLGRVMYLCSSFFYYHILSVLLCHSTETCLWCPLLWSHIHSNGMCFLLFYDLRFLFTETRSKSQVFSRKKRHISPQKNTMQRIQKHMISLVWTHADVNFSSSWAVLLIIILTWQCFPSQVPGFFYFQKKRKPFFEPSFLFHLSSRRGKGEVGATRTLHARARARIRYLKCSWSWAAIP